MGTWTTEEPQSPKTRDSALLALPDTLLALTPFSPEIQVRIYPLLLILTYE